MIRGSNDIFDEKLVDIERIVREEGLIFIGIVQLLPMPLEAARFSQWIEQGRHANMHFLTQNIHIRANPRYLLDNAKTAIVIGLPYALGDHLPRPEDPPRIAQYARLKDYHRVIRTRGQSILQRLHTLLGKSEAQGRVVTDSAPILERALASKTGNGFIGKNTCFISPQRGSFILLGELLTTLDLCIPKRNEVELIANKRTAQGGCGTCRRCQVKCPTGALDEDYRIDARKCLAYWTIEHRGPIPERFWPWLAKYLFGCDICQIVCPYNRGKSDRAPSEIIKLEKTPKLFEVATMDQTRYEQLFGGTPMTRAKRTGLMRNALIAMTVTGDNLLESAIKHIQATEKDATLNATLDQIRDWIRQQTSSQ